MNLLLSYYDAAAHAAALCGVESVPVLPDVSAVNAYNTLRKIHQCGYADVNDQSSLLTYAMASTIAEKRSFAAMSNIYALAELYKASFMRLPLVAANFSRSLGTFTVKTDLTDIFAVRDAGWLIFLAESPQELLDSIVLAYRVCEDSRVMLPALVNTDGIANMREPVNVPNRKIIDNFLPKLKLTRKLKDNVVFGPPVVEEYQEFREQQQLAMKNAASIIVKTAEKWKEKFKRSYGLVEKVGTEDAEYVIVAAGFYSSAARLFVQKARQQGEKVGLLRIRVARPWPYTEIQEALRNAKKVAVVDRGVSLGASGFMHNELRSAHPFCSSFVSYSHLGEKDFVDLFLRLKKQEKPETVWM